ncbi:helix-turn-helix domain-containing protein [Flavobacterium sp. KACC 22761]|uniref:helix-turn-helix transcriptional regulator n=1 Tax=Flavobacterium sp. KACC 22761 TaxID=3092665 RepID=UPI002A7638CB|nr:helix-turn-helix domain-containing protein [Flavobacterium sp. KACC 22761]WPO78198.1 helix-turn-helix domain-containing protein [Flavobacterium sp. KACC 22761]
MESNAIFQKLAQLEKLIIGTTKQIFTVDDVVNYTGFSKSYVYKLVHMNILPYSKPNNRTLFFTKSEIDEWLLQNKSKSISQIQKEATSYTNSHKK